VPALILIRHSISDVDFAKPYTEWGLTAAGERAAAELADLLGAFNPKDVVTSPERKARATAAILSDRQGVPTHIEPDLREHERSSIGKLPRSDFDDGIRRLLCSTDDLVFGDETADAVFRRFSFALERARSAAPEHDVFAVTHGTAISIYVGRILGIDPVAFWHDLPMPAAVIISDQGMQLVTPPGAGVR
jgi:broad specificity phosphatase PhoE